MRTAGGAIGKAGCKLGESPFGGLLIVSCRNPLWSCRTSELPDNDKHLILY